jgi:hypothetical protein
VKCGGGAFASDGSAHLAYTKNVLLFARGVVGFCHGGSSILARVKRRPADVKLDDSLVRHEESMNTFCTCWYRALSSVNVNVELSRALVATCCLKACEGQRSPRNLQLPGAYEGKIAPL